MYLHTNDPIVNQFEDKMELAEILKSKSLNELSTEGEVALEDFLLDVDREDITNTLDNNCEKREEEENEDNEEFQF